jgi:hypothetical protein
LPSIGAEIAFLGELPRTLAPTGIRLPDGFSRFLAAFS